MKKHEIHLSAAEWAVMECLWEDAPLIGREITLRMEQSMGWSRSTTLTLLRRLEEKGAAASDDLGKIKKFYPLISREDAAVQETESFLERVYHGSLSLLVHAMTRKQSLSRKEIDELQSMLNDLGGGEEHD